MRSMQNETHLAFRHPGHVFDRCRRDLLRNTSQMSKLVGPELLSVFIQPMTHLSIETRGNVLGENPQPRDG